MKKHKKLLVLWLMILALFSTELSVSAASTFARRPKETFVILHRSNNQIYRKIPVKNGTCKLPGVKNPKGYTFLGWSSQKKQTKNPKYFAGQKISVKKNTHLYPVFFNRKKEVDIEPWELPTIDDVPYSKVIFVGDSRTFKMKETFLRQCSRDTLRDIDFVCKSGKGLSWFKQEGYPLLKQKIAQAQKHSSEPVAIIFNLGVNDIRYVSGKAPDCPRVLKEYISYFNKLGQKLSSKNCKLFYMSVNPVNSCMIRYAMKKDEDVRYFNHGLQKYLSKRFTYLDTYNRLARYGYSTNNDVYDDNVDDGLHYSMATYKRIYRMCMDKICCS